MVTKNIFLYIGGFLIKVSFHPSEMPFFINSLQKEILSFFKWFIITTNRRKKIDFIIHIYDMPHKIYSFKKNKENYKEFISLFLEQIGKNEVVAPSHLSLNQFAHLINFIIIKLLSVSDGFVLHSSAIKLNKKALIFTGASGAGKSTTVKLLQGKFSALEDDRVIIKKVNNQFYFFHSAFFIKNKYIKRNIDKYPIQAIFVLKKARYFKIDKLTNKDIVFNLLVDQLVVDADTLHASIKNLQKFISYFDNFYYLYLKKNRKKMIDFISNLSYS